ncbi:MAG: B12-binding domain-containing radical SAM protein [Candidatus Bathyarchaeota archaeon]|nr:B12-binding domain-containing radical SAM protein [Candidatus Bathyarchaeota archaeon]
MRIALLCPKYSFEGYTPTGLVTIAAVAEQLGHTVVVADLNVEPLPQGRFDLVGITGLSLWKKQIIETAGKFKDTPIILGGPWASLYPEQALSACADYVCRGEGEDTLHEFLERYPNVENVLGIGFRTGDGFHLNPRRPFITDLDRLPLAAWHLIKLKKYKRVSIVSSRGCPFRCIFCSDHTLHGRGWRARSVSSVISELELLSGYGVNHVTFGDENMTLKPERFEQICETIIQKKFKMSFDAIQGVRADRLPFRLLELMKQADFVNVIFAPESGVQRVLDEVIHKDLDLSVVEPVVKKCRDINLPCGAFFVVGFPWETMEEIRQTIKFADKLRVLGCSCFVGNALPFPDTELYARAKAEGFLRFDGEKLEEILCFLGKPRKVHCLSSPYWEPEQIIAICKREEKKNLRAVYRAYSKKKIVSKFLRHPFSSIKKAAKVLR